MVTHEIVLKKIEENKETMKKFGVNRIELSGSSVKGEQQKRSDIDILVEFEKGKKTFDNSKDLKFFLEDLFDCKVDLVVKDHLVTKGLDETLDSMRRTYVLSMKFWFLLLLALIILYFLLLVLI